MGNGRTISVGKKNYALSCLAVVAAVAANVLMFCILAVARTMPLSTNPEEYEYRAVIALDVPVPTSPEPAARQTVMDVVQLGDEATDRQSPPPVAKMASSTFPLLAERIDDISLELPGLPVRSSNLSLQSSASAESVGIIDGPTSVPKVDRLPSKTEGPLPRYPQWARRDKLEGAVTLRFIVTAQGTVEDININEIQGDERFGDEAVRVVSQWRFSPAIRAGKPVPCWCFQKINFEFIR